MTVWPLRVVILTFINKYWRLITVLILRDNGYKPEKCLLWDNVMFNLFKRNLVALSQNLQSKNLCTSADFLWKSALYLFLRKYTRRSRSGELNLISSALIFPCCSLSIQSLPFSFQTSPKCDNTMKLLFLWCCWWSWPLFVQTVVFMFAL